MANLGKKRSKMSWLARLASELTERGQYNVTEDDLRAQLQLFIAKCDDKYLRDSYPKDVNRLGGRPHERSTSHLRRLAHHPSVTGALVERFLSSPEIGHLDARNALPGLVAD
jgi:hypothetical protein